MDTDDLSNEAYEAVIIEAERFHHNLTLHFGVLADDCDTNVWTVVDVIFGGVESRRTKVEGQKKKQIIFNHNN